MKFSDILKNSFIEKFAGTEFDLKAIITCLIISTILALYIFLRLFSSS